MLKVTLLVLDLVETPGENEVGLLRADIGLFLLVVLLLMPFSKDLRAELKASLRSKFERDEAGVFCFSFVRVAANSLITPPEEFEELVRLRVCFCIAAVEFGLCFKLFETEIEEVRPVIVTTWQNSPTTIIIQFRLNFICKTKHIS